MVRGAGLDFVFIDTEHNALDRLQLAWMCEAYRAVGVAPIVRIPEPDPYRACMALDGGAEGIIAPYVETPSRCRRSAARPDSARSKASDFSDRSPPPPPRLPSSRNSPSDLARRNAGTVLIVNIESTPAMGALDEILGVPGLDAVLIGPHDLSCSLGIPEQYTHPRFDEAVRTIFRKARARNVGAGIHFWTSIEQEIRWAKEDARELHRPQRRRDVLRPGPGGRPQDAPKSPSASTVARRGRRTRSDRQGRKGLAQKKRRKGRFA